MENKSPWPKYDHLFDSFSGFTNRLKFGHCMPIWRRALALSRQPNRSTTESWSSRLPHLRLSSTMAYFWRRTTTLKKPSRPTRRVSPCSSGRMCLTSGALTFRSSWSATAAKRLSVQEIYLNNVLKRARPNLQRGRLSCAESVITYFAMESITLTSCFICLDSAALLMLN